jgi:hypothetical protein
LLGVVGDSPCRGLNPARDARLLLFDLPLLLSVWV